MSLATRLTTFFLSALAIVLAGLLVTLYLLARTHFAPGPRRADDPGLDGLLPSVSIDSDEVEGKPGRAAPRRSPAQPSRSDEPVRWAVFDDRGRRGRSLLGARPRRPRRGSTSMAPAVGHSTPDSYAGKRADVWRLVVRASPAGNASDEESEDRRGRRGAPGRRQFVATGRLRLVLAAGASARRRSRRACATWRWTLIGRLDRPLAAGRGGGAVLVPPGPPAGHPMAEAARLDDRRRPRPSAADAPAPATSSTGWPARSTACSTASTRRSSGRSGSPATPRTSSGRR